MSHSLLALLKDFKRGMAIVNCATGTVSHYSWWSSDLVSLFKSTQETERYFDSQLDERNAFYESLGIS